MVLSGGLRAVGNGNHRAEWWIACRDLLFVTFRDAGGLGWLRTVKNKLRILVSVSLFSWLAWRTDWDQIRQAGANLRIEYWLAALALYLGIQMISGFRWQLLAKPLGYERPVWQFTRFYFIGMFFNLFLPTSVGGDVVRAWYLGDGSEASAFLSVLVDRLSGFVVLLALACIAVALCPIHLPGWIVMSVWCSAGTGMASARRCDWLRNPDRNNTPWLPRGPVISLRTTNGCTSVSAPTAQSNCLS